MTSLKSATIAATAALTLFDVAAVEAADLGSRREPIAAMIAAPADLWTGFYLGGHLGYRTESTSIYFENFFYRTVHPNSVVGGLHAGYNMLVSPNILLGLEAAGSIGGGSATTPGGYATVKSGWDAQFRARAGFVHGQWLVFAAAGLALQDQRYEDIDGFRLSKTRLGWTVGAGIEYAIDPAWRVRAEYLYSNFGTSTALDNYNSPFSLKTDTHTFRLGVSYRFATGGSAFGR
ncbi:MAG: outer membrane protein [Phreatobacter sp.]